VKGLDPGVTEGPTGRLDEGAFRRELVRRVAS